MLQLLYIIVKSDQTIIPSSSLLDNMGYKMQLLHKFQSEFKFLFTETFPTKKYKIAKKLPS